MLVDLHAPIRMTAFGHVRQKRGYWHDGKRLERHLLLILTSGSLQMTVDGTAYSLSVGDALLIPAGTLYRPGRASDCGYYFIHFVAAPATDTAADWQVVRRPLPAGDYSYAYSDTVAVVEVATYTPAPEDGCFAPILERMAALDPFRRPAEKLLLDTWMRELLIVVSTVMTGECALHPQLRRILRRIEEDPRADHSLAALSADVGLSASYVARLFREELHTTSSAYVNRVRVREARRLLAMTDLSISAVAAQVGFEDAYYFSRVFRAAEGITPGRFRKIGRKEFFP